MQILKSGQNKRASGAPEVVQIKSVSRRAWAQPRFLLAGAGLAIAGCSLVALAQQSKSSRQFKPVSMAPASKVGVANHSLRYKPTSLSDLPELVKGAGITNRANLLVNGASNSGSQLSINAIGTGESGYNLVEVDLTPNSASNEREPAYSPGGDYIAFSSNGADTNNDGKIDSIAADNKYHIWIMNSDGSNQRRLTGFGRDNIARNDGTRNQRRPSWSPNGNRLVYIDGDGTDAQVYTVGFNSLFFNRQLPGTASDVPSATRLTDFTSQKMTPIYAPTGQSVVFASDRDPVTPANQPNQFDIFSVQTDGTYTAAYRLTGGTSDAVGKTTNDWAPAYSVVNNNVLYFSSNRDGNTVLSPGRRIWEMRSDGTNKVQVSNPLRRENGKVSDIDDNPSASNTAFPSATVSSTSGGVLESVAFQSNSLIDSSDTTADYNIWNLQNDTEVPPSTPSPALETNGAALVATNILSSPLNLTKSDIPQGSNVTQDQADDVEPGYSRRYNTAVDTSRLAFASQRKFAPNPASNGSTSVNPTGSFDIWTTQVVDSTAPILVPIDEGNSKFPVIAPRDDSPLSGAPRTPDAGLQAGGTTKIAFVLREDESGLVVGTNSTSVRVDIHNAVGPGRFASFDDPTPTPVPSPTPTATPDPSVTPVPTAYPIPPLIFPNDPIKVSDARETTSIVAKSYTGFAIYDDGPTPSGHEKQANAKAGDGIYYCEKTITTPTEAGDYYMDIVVKDRALNTFTFDNIWGFSTLPFAKNASGQGDLFVSDYTVGQVFPAAAGDSRFSLMPPVESYWLSNPGGQVYEDTGNPPKLGATSYPDSFTNMEVWRTLCRGGVPQDVLDAYAPRATLQIDPNDATKKFTALTRSVPVSNSMVVWAAPYAGEAFAGPGTIIDPAIQVRLTNYLKNGGRLLISGRNIAYGLTSGGAFSNTFLKSELAANYKSETQSYILNDGPGGLLDYINNFNVSQPDFNNLQIGFHTSSPPSNYNDAALNQDVESPAASAAIDVITPQTVANGRVTTAYTTGAGVVGQRVEQDNRNNSFQSRLVFLSFGLEAVNRRYRATSSDWATEALNTRRAFARNVESYFKTGVLTGEVTNSDTNEPVPGFLVKITSGTTTYLARTDANGKYQLSGLPEGSYTVQAYTDASNQTLPAGYRPGTTTGAYFGIVKYVFPSWDEIVQRTDNANFKVIPLRPGGVRGYVYTANGTPTDRSDDFAVRDVPVLLKSVDSSPSFPKGGQYAALTRTNNDGLYSFSNVPSGTKLIVVINPHADSVDSNGIAKGGDFPANVELNYSQGPLLNYGRRAVPFDSLNNDKADVRDDDIIAPENDNYFVNDVASGGTDTSADSGVPLLLPSLDISGTVTLKIGNGSVTPLAGASVQLLNGSNTPVGSAFTTLADGKFVFPQLTYSNYTVRVTSGSTLDGYTIPSKQISIAAADLSSAGKGLNFDFTIANVQGTVTASGVAASGFQVTLLQNGNPVTFGSFTRTAITNASGQYTINYVPAGNNYAVRVTKALSGITLDKTSTTFSVPATGVVTAPAVNFPNQFDLVSGRVTLGADNVSGATVKLVKGNTEVASTTTNSSGLYNFNTVTSGTYQVVVSFVSNGTPLTKTSDSFTITNPSGANRTVNFAFTLDQLNGIGGTVTVNGVAYPGAVVQLYNSKKRAISPVTTVTTDANGQYLFASALADPRYYVRATITILGRNYLSPMVVANVVNGKATANIAFTNISRLTGRVLVNGTGTSGVIVELLDSKGKSLKPQRLETTNASGQYNFFAPKTGSLIVRATLGDSTAQVVVKVKSGVSTAPDINLTRQQALGMVSLRSNGSVAPLPGANIVVYQGTTRIKGPFVTDSKGNFDVRDLPIGTYTFRITKTTDSGTLDQSFTVRQGLGLVDLRNPGLILDGSSINQF